jgi:hypothetical protein
VRLQVGLFCEKLAVVPTGSLRPVPCKEIDVTSPFSPADEVDWLTLASETHPTNNTLGGILAHAQVSAQLVDVIAEGMLV